MQVKGIDISAWQGNLTLDNFKQIKDNGIQFIMIRCGYTGYGKSKSMYVDKYFENNYKLCKQLNIPIGTYYYSCATTVEEAQKEAEFTLQTIKGKTFEYPVVVDTEDNHDINNQSYSATSQSSIGKTKLTPVIIKFCDILEKAGYYASIYASTYWFKNNLILNDLKKYDKWIAQWSNSVNFSEPYGMWQYSATGSVLGIIGYTDMNYAYKDYPKIMTSVGLNGYPKPTIPEEKPEPPVEPTPPEEKPDVKPEPPIVPEPEVPVNKVYKLLQIIFDGIINLFKSILEYFKPKN